MNRFYSTYEELKLILILVFLSLYSVFTVPMRNWNYPIFSTVSKLIAPGFYSTYEELKPPEQKLHPSEIACFYSTYEELKHSINHVKISAISVFLQYLWGIET